MPTKSKSAPAPLNEDAIRQRAYLMWEADGRPEGLADHYWMKASEPLPDVSAKPKATAGNTATAVKTAKPRGKAIKTEAKAADKPKLKAAAAKVSAPAVKAKPAAKAPARKAAKKA